MKGWCRVRGEEKEENERIGKDRMGVGEKDERVERKG